MKQTDESHKADKDAALKKREDFAVSLRQKRHHDVIESKRK